MNYSEMRLLNNSAEDNGCDCDCDGGCDDGNIDNY